MSIDLQISASTQARTSVELPRTSLSKFVTEALHPTLTLSTISLITSYCISKRWRDLSGFNVVTYIILPGFLIHSKVPTSALFESFAALFTFTHLGKPPSEWKNEAETSFRIHNPDGADATIKSHEKCMCKTVHWLADKGSYI